METRLEQVQKQHVSQKMIQSVSILQMGTTELLDYIREALLENPVIEPIDIEPAGAGPAAPQERISRLEWLDAADEQNRWYVRGNRSDGEESGRGYDSLAGRSAERLSDSLRLQLMRPEYTPLEQRVFDYIIENLDSRGYYPYPAAEIARVFRIPEQAAGHCLEIMRGLDPPGICAGSLRDCLLRQLAGREDCELERTIIRNHLEQLGRGQLAAIARELRTDPARVAEAAAEIRALNPNPAQGFDNGEPDRYVVPDIIVERLEDRFEIRLSSHTCPTLRISQEYLGLLRSDCGAEVKEYLTRKMAQAEELRGYISRRGSTLMAIAACILKEQNAFFLNGQDALRPFRLAQAAEQIGCNSSTVSRAVKDKYLQCSWGVFPLSFFFPKGVAAQGEDAPLSVDRIKQELAGIIQQEDRKKPYSDAKLADILNTRGMSISRRTVAKYREEMGLADCRARKLFL